MSDATKTEGELTRGISNETVCMYFYVVFFAVALLAAISVGADLLVMSKRPALGASLLLRSAPVLILSVTNALFLYILCARTLLK
jgi:hypothetical protein